MLLDLWGLRLHKPTNEAFLQYLKLTGSSSLLELVQGLQKLLCRNRPLVEELLKNNFKKGPMGFLTGDYKVPIGQLSFKKEAAGKLRIFALVDSWTQTVMDPLHQAMFSILKGLPNDGTFDQDASFRRCQVKSAQFGVAFGYDLSSATDRLPMSLQVSLLSSLTSSQLLAEC
jgi:hypothetical protein